MSDTGSIGGANSGVRITGGAGTIAGGIDAIKFSGSYAGRVVERGTGTLALSGADTLGNGAEIDGGRLDVVAWGSAGSGPITFGAGYSGTLKVEGAALGTDALQSFSNTITGFTSGATLDIGSIGTATTSFNYASDTLSLVENGATVATLQLVFGGSDPSILDPSCSLPVRAKRDETRFLPNLTLPARKVPRLRPAPSGSRP